MRISDWSSDVCSSDLGEHGEPEIDTGREVRALVVDDQRLELLRHDLQRLADDLEHLRVHGVHLAVHLEAHHAVADIPQRGRAALCQRRTFRSEEHTSELQSLMRISYAVFCLKKKNNNKRK